MTATVAKTIFSVNIAELAKDIPAATYSTATT